MKIRSWDGVTLNEPGYMLFGAPQGASWAYQATANLERRSGRTPILISEEKSARSLSFQIMPSNEMSALDRTLLTYRKAARRLFRVGGKRLKPLVLQLDLEDPDSLIVCYGIVTDMDQAPRGMSIYQGEILVPDGYWYTLNPITETSSPFTVGGNADTHPKITLARPATATRLRLTVKDRTREGIGGWLVGYDWTADPGETWIWANGVSVPFATTDSSRIWFRVDVNTEGPTLVDLYHADGSDNSTHAEKLDRAGITLNAGLAARTSVTAEMMTAGSNAISSNLTWHPGITAAHESNVPYTFGLSAEGEVTLIDREASGERNQLADDADSFVFSSPVEIANMTAFTATVRSGIRQPEASSDDSASSISSNPYRPAVLKMNVLAGEPSGDMTEFYEGEFVTHWTSGVPQGTLPPPYYVAELSWGGGRASVLDYAGEFLPDDPSTNPHTDFRRTATFDGSSFNGGVSDLFGDVASVSGSYPEYTITFTDPEGGALNFPSLSTSNIDFPIVLGNQWVDPVTGGPLQSSSPNSPDNGKIRVVLRYRVRDDESWYTKWSTVVQGDLAGSAQVINIPAQTFPSGAVQIAFGLESIADGVNSIDWGILTPTSSPVFSFTAGRTPLIEASDEIEAQYIDGQISIDGDEDELNESFIRCKNTFCDNGVEFDADFLTIRGVNNVGPVYGSFEFADPNLWSPLSPGDISFDAEDLDVIFLFTERYEI